VLVAGLLQSSPASATDPEFKFTWRDLADGTVTHTVKNSETTAEKWTANVVPLAPQSQGPPALVVEPQSVSVAPPLKSVEFRLRLNATARPAPGSTFRYLLTVERTNGDQITTERAVIRIGPVYSLIPQSQSAKYVLTATRPIPFLSPWEIKLPLHLADAADPQRVKEGEDRPLGVLYVASPTTGLDHSGVIRWNKRTASADTTAIGLQLDFPRWSSAKLSGTLTFPDGQTRDVVVQTSDYVVYPLIVILAGVLVAYWVKRYVTRGRALLVLRATLADTEARLKLADAEFARMAEDRPANRFDIQSAWSKARQDVEAEITAVQLTTGPLDQTNSAFIALNTKLTQLRKLPAEWIALATSLRVLDGLHRGIADIAVPPTMKGRPAIEGVLEKAVNGEPLASVDGLSVVTARITSLTTFAQSWRAAWDRSVRLLAQTKDATTLAEIDQAQRELWLGADESRLPPVKLLLDSATARIVKDGGTTGRRETVGTPERQVPEPQAPIVVPEALKVQRDDRLAILVALAVAVVAGLNAEYFGKPFGSLADYSRVLGWALSASIGVDLASMALNRIGSTLASPRVTRA
jgi:hypothetical protein